MSDAVLDAILDERRAREERILARMRAPRPCSAFYAGRCRCGASWKPGDVIFRSPLPNGPRPMCFDCGLADAEANK